MLKKLLSNTKIKLFLLILASIASTSCLDMLSYTTVDKSGNVSSSVKVTISKSILAMAAMFDEDSDIDYNEIFDMSTMEEIDYISSYNLINTDFEYGVHLDISIPKKQLDKLDIYDDISSFVPIKKGNSYYMVFQQDDNIDEETMMMLSSLKYQVFISKSYIKEIKSVIITNNEDDEYHLDFYDFKDSYLIEVPMAFLGYGELIINP